MPPLPTPSTCAELNRLDPIDFGRRLAVERELAADTSAPHPNAVFDASGNFLLYPTLLGVKVCVVRWVRWA